ncbi:hypothetical protein [Candidatus Electrothrix sp.]
MNEQGGRLFFMVSLECGEKGEEYVSANKQQKITTTIEQKTDYE